MRGIKKLITTATLLGVALLPTVAAVPPDPPAARDGRMPVAIAQPLAAIDSSSILVGSTGSGRSRRLPETGMLVLVGAALLGLAAIVRKTT